MGDDCDEFAGESKDVREILREVNMHVAELDGLRGGYFSDVDLFLNTQHSIMK